MFDRTLINVNMYITSIASGLAWGYHGISFHGDHDTEGFVSNVTKAAIIAASEMTRLMQDGHVSQACAAGAARISDGHDRG